MRYYGSKERKHVPQWVNLATYVKVERVVPLGVRVAQAVRTMHSRWVAHDARNDRYVDYFMPDYSENDTDSEREDDSDYADDPDEEWSTRKKNSL